MKKEHEFTQLMTKPIGPLAVIALDSMKEMGKRADDYLKKWRHDNAEEDHELAEIHGYIKDTFLVKTKCPRFGSGEGKGIIEETIRGKDVYLLCDITNHSITYKMCGFENHKSPDDHYQDLKRIIAAIAGKAKRINVIMPFLYEGRQHKRSTRESLDCAICLQELVSMGVENIITFDAHDPRVQNAIPKNGFETVRPSYQFIKTLLKNVDDLKLDRDNLMMISPDEGATERAVYLASILGVDMGMFYKRRDYTRLLNGKNPIIAHEFLGNDLNGKDVIVIDDMISSGDSIIDTARELKKRNANRIIVFSTFGLFTNGMDKFDKAYEDGLIFRVVTTNLVYQPYSLLKREYYLNCDMSKYLSYVIDTLNHDTSLSDILDPVDKIKKIVEDYKNK